MDEPSFWDHLEYRVSREFAGMREKHLQGMWCDGFVPVQYILDDPSPHIAGVAWICFGLKQEEWRFTLILPRAVNTPEEIDWAAILPPDNVTRWITLDPKEKQIHIEPSAAIPDLDAQAK